MTPLLVDHSKPRSSSTTEVIQPTGAMLVDVLSARQNESHHGLSRRANAQLDAALRKTAWGQRSQRTYAVVCNGVVLASAERYELKSLLNGRPGPITGIGSVHCGGSSREADAMRQLIEWLAKDIDTPLTLLFPSPSIDALTIGGFDTIPRTETTVRVIEDVRRGAPMTTIRAGEARDLQAIEAMGRKRASGVRLALDRDADFIQYVLTRRRLLCGLGRAHARQLQFFIAEEGITAAAYVVLSVTAHDWIIEECGDRDPSGARVGALLQALIAREPSRQRPTIRTVLPPGFLPPQIKVVSTRPAAVGLRMVARDYGAAAFYADDVLYWPNDVL
jgi:hypothetical protein